MPIYEYRCGECGHQEEHLQKISERPLARCPACGKKAYKKRLSAAGFQLKGSGWYATDFKNTGKSAAKKDEKTSTADKKTDSEKKTETKVDKKTETKTDKKTETKTDSSKACAASATD